MNRLSREMPIDPPRAALLVTDVQNYRVRPGAGATEYFRRSLRDIMLPNIRRVQSACRAAGIDVVYSVIDNMTRDACDLGYLVNPDCGLPPAHAEASELQMSC